MKVLSLFIFAIVVLLSLASFALAEELNEDELKAMAAANVNYSDFSITSDFSMIKLVIESGNADKIIGQKLDGALGYLLKNEMVNVYATPKTGEEIKIYIETEESTIKNIGLGESEEPTIKVWMDEKMINEAKGKSGESGNFLKQAYRDGAIKIKGVGLIKRFKLWILIRAGKSSGMI